MRVLMTGHQGYIGSMMAPLLEQAGHEVFGLDAGYFAECSFVPERLRIPGVVKDLRDLVPSDLNGFQAVVHLAALSNDPLSSLNDEWTREINLDASVRLARLAREAGVERFLFASSCIMYGGAGRGESREACEVDENSPLDPKTAYARSKVEAERAIRALATPRFSPVFLRNGTVYGVSPHMRFDTVLNHLVGSALATGRIAVLGDGRPWRPVVHIEDVAAVFLAALSVPRQRLHNQALNAAADSVNCRIGDLANIVAEAVPGSSVEIRAEPGADQRTYRARFHKIAALLPEFRLKHSVREGVRRLVGELRTRGLSDDEFTSDSFTRLSWLTRLRESGRLDQTLRWSAPVEAGA